ncbi:MAG: acylphosphatase [Candidatus Doudnabacteria bacterium]|nr:acylphosphatase [bacterium]MDZ4244249.1 acylphosphatase [Candidatus Doudnabacteria bacterium]
MQERAELHLKIHGQVHGVGFRYFAKLKARDLGLVGYVRNLSDGTVEIAAQGTKEDLEKLVDWAKTGPRLAGVDRIETTYTKSKKEYTKFSIV